MVQKYVFLTKNFEKSVNISTEIHQKVVKKQIFVKTTYSQCAVNQSGFFFWIRNKILDFLRPSDSHLGQNWRFSFQIPSQRTNAPSPFDFEGGMTIELECCALVLNC